MVVACKTHLYEKIRLQPDLQFIPTKLVPAWVCNIWAC